MAVLCCGSVLASIRPRTAIEASKCSFLLSLVPRSSHRCCMILFVHIMSLKFAWPSDQVFQKAWHQPHVWAQHTSSLSRLTTSSVLTSATPKKTCSLYWCTLAHWHEMIFKTKNDKKTNWTGVSPGHRKDSVPKAGSKKRKKSHRLWEDEWGRNKQSPSSRALDILGSWIILGCGISNLRPRQGTKGTKATKAGDVKERKVQSKSGEELGDTTTKSKWRVKVVKVESLMMVLICYDMLWLRRFGMFQGIDPQQNCQEKQVGTGVVNCEVSCDWRFHPLPARRNFRKNGLLLSPSVFSSWVAAKK